MSVAKRRISNDERRNRSTEAVLSAALELFVSKGFKATSIDDIARHAKLTKGAVYFYFKDKTALLLSVLEQSRDLYGQLFDELRDSELEATVKIERFIAWAAQVGAENKELLLLPILVSLEFSGRDDRVTETVASLYRSYHEEIAAILHEGRQAGEFKDTVPLAEQAAVIVAATDGMLLEWFRWGHTLNGRALFLGARQMIISGICN